MQGQLLIVASALLVLGKVAGVVRRQVQQRFHPSAAAVAEQRNHVPQGAAVRSVQAHVSTALSHSIWSLVACWSAQRSICQLMGMF